MYTDWVMIRRLAYEIEAQFRGASVRDVGMLPDGRTALELWMRGATTLLCIDLFSSPPLVTSESGDLPIATEPGFIRATGATLRGTKLLAARARRNDRLLRLTFGTRSRFGVGDECDLYIELVPRFGNIILVKSDRIVTAAKEFSIAENPARAIEAGRAYTPPPPHARPPLAPHLADAALDDDELLRTPLYVYRRDGRIAQAYVAPLEGFDDADCTRVPSLLETLRAFRDERAREGTHHRGEQRRTAIIKDLDVRAKKVRDELAALAAKRRKADSRESLREAGESIYACLHELQNDAARDEAKEIATKHFAEYKKLGASIPHLDERERILRGLAHAIDTLRWEAERAADEDIDDVRRAVTDLTTRPRTDRPESREPRRRKRAPLEHRTADGARILVGRSPSENADLTFRIARPHDLWFHAKDIPGAHVILQRDDRTPASDDDIEIAASFAAHYSKARTSAKVAVDYTQRKHVRKQKNAPPGLVWYTDFKTILAAPTPR